MTMADIAIAVVRGTNRCCNHGISMSEENQQ